MASDPSPNYLLLLLTVLTREQQSAKRDAALARRRCERAELDAGWTAAAVLGEAAGMTFRARGVAIRLARAVAAHREAVPEPCGADRELWAILDETWQGIDSEWRLTTPVVKP
jgi:hypothetical protein